MNSKEDQNEPFSSRQNSAVKNMRSEKKNQKSISSLRIPSPSRLNFDVEPNLISPYKDSAFKAFNVTPFKNEECYDSPNGRGIFNSPIVKMIGSSNHKSFFSLSNGKDPHQLSKKLDFTSGENENEQMSAFFGGNKQSGFVIPPPAPALIQNPQTNASSFPSFSPVKHTTIQQFPPETAKTKILVKNGVLVGEKITCTCTKTECLKSYCACYKANRKCVLSCTCKNCKNKDGDFLSAKKSAGDQNININNVNMSEEGKVLIQTGKICNCSKSSCQKRYCECFKQDRRCSEKCHCSGCRNREGVTRSEYRPLFNTTSKESSNPSPISPIESRFVTEKMDRERVPSMIHLDEIKDKPLTKFLNLPLSFSLKLRPESVHEIFVREGRLRVENRAISLPSSNIFSTPPNNNAVGGSNVSSTNIVNISNNKNISVYIVEDNIKNAPKVENAKKTNFRKSENVGTPSKDENGEDNVEKNNVENNIENINAENNNVANNANNTTNNNAANNANSNLNTNTNTNTSNPHSKSQKSKSKSSNLNKKEKKSNNNKNNNNNNNNNVNNVKNNKKYIDMNENPEDNNTIGDNNDDHIIESNNTKHEKNNHLKHEYNNNNNILKQEKADKNSSYIKPEKPENLKQEKHSSNIKPENLKQEKHSLNVKQSNLKQENMYSSSSPCSSVHQTPQFTNRKRPRNETQTTAQTSYKSKKVMAS